MYVCVCVALTGTQLEDEPLRCCYSATENGWSAAAFHERVDGYGAALVVARTQVRREERGGAVLCCAELWCLGGLEVWQGVVLTQHGGGAAVSGMFPHQT